MTLSKTKLAIIVAIALLAGAKFKSTITSIPVVGPLAS